MIRDIRGAHDRLGQAIRRTGTTDLLLESALSIARAGELHWASAPAHKTPVTAAAIVTWFSHAFNTKTVPDEVCVRNLVGWLNVAGPWDTDTVKRLHTVPPDHKKLSKAISTILELAPSYIELSEIRLQKQSEDAYLEQIRREWHGRRIAALRSLLIGAEAAAEEFPVLSSAGKKKPPYWKTVAQSAASFITAALIQAGYPAPNFNGGPALEVLQQAMKHLEGKERPLSQLREAFRH